MENYDLKIIKKLYGEGLARFCRDNFSTILETEGELSSLITALFHPSKFFYKEILMHNEKASLKNYILSRFHGPKPVESTETVYESPFKLLKKAGYTLYKCDTTEDILKFQKYWAGDELLCTFYDDQRIEKCLVFFAVKDNAESLDRSYFHNPQRQDEYGTSVISIQFEYGYYNNVSIKNRYNHSVTNPDATFSNNLDNIIEGLTASFAQHFRLRFMDNNLKKIKIPGYVYANDGKYYPSNIVLGDIVFCADNIMIQYGDVVKFDKSQFELVDNYLIDKKNNQIIRLPLGKARQNDAFVDIYHNKIKKIQVKNNKDGTRTITIVDFDDRESYITVDERNRIVGYVNEHVTKIGDNFLTINETLRFISLPNVIKIGSDFLLNNTELDSIDFPSLKTVGNLFISSNKQISALCMPELKRVGDCFLSNNIRLKELSLPSLCIAADDFLIFNESLERIFCPKLEIIGKGFLKYNKSLIEVKFERLQVIDESFLKFNEILRAIDAPKLRKVKGDFLPSNTGLTTLDLPRLTTVLGDFLPVNEDIEYAFLPLLHTAMRILTFNKRLKKCNFSSLRNFDSERSFLKLPFEELLAQKCKQSKKQKSEIEK